MIAFPLAPFSREDTNYFSISLSFFFKKIFICSAHVHHKLWIAFPMAVDPGDTIICQRHPLRDWTIRRPRLAGLSIIQTVKPAAKSYALAVCQ